MRVCSKTCATGTESPFTHPCYTSIKTVCLFPFSVRSLPLKEEHWFSLQPPERADSPNFSTSLGVFWPAVHRSWMKREFFPLSCSLPDSFPVCSLFFIVPAKGCPVRKQQGEILPLNAPNISIKDRMRLKQLKKTAITRLDQHANSAGNMLKILHMFKHYFCVF